MLNEILNTIPCGIMIVDSRLTVYSMNTHLEQLTGYRNDEVVGIGADFILRSDVRAGDRLAKEVMNGGEKALCRGTILNRNKFKLPVQFTISPLSDCGNGQLGVVIVVEEVPGFAGEERRPGRTALIGNSPQMQKIFERMEILARTDVSVLITGETGCGKDCIAEELHYASERAQCPFIKVNCGALPEALLESELFGHMRGAFTGAVKDHPGMFRLADKGTLFLTEIGDLSLPLQVKLLSVLDDRQFFPVGSAKKVRVDVRVIAATHRDLRKEVAEGRFREDLFFRLNVLHLYVPPLREREGDVRLLLNHFLRRSSRADNLLVRDFDLEALDVLNCYSWPGNVRELRNVVEYSVHMCRGELIGRSDLPDYIFKPMQTESEPKNTFRSQQQYSRVLPVVTGADYTERERQRIHAALLETGGRKRDAAKLLSMGRTTLWRKMRQYGLE